MTRTRRWWAAIGLLVSSAAGYAQGPPVRAATAVTDSVRWARVTYLAGRSVYVDAGRDDGLEIGASVQVVRRRAIVASLRVTATTSHRASCEIVSGDSLTIVVGDSVRYEPRDGQRTTSGIAGQESVGAPAAGPRVQSDSASVRGSSRTGRSLREAGLRGRIGIRYLMASERGTGTRFSQPSADVRLEGTSIAGSPFGLAIDARGRRTVASGNDTSGSRAFTRAHVYRLAVSAATPGGGRIAVGRQFSEAFSNVSLYDGISIEVQRPRWGTGGFAGTQPAPGTMSYSRDVREYGGYVQAHAPSGGTRHWTLTAGAIGSYHAAVLNREFAFAQLAVSSPRLSLFAAQEVDYNRGWKVAQGERTLQPTSTFASAQIRPTASFTMQAGFDTRRNVRLWRDRENPETEFDDRFRQGVWGGASLRAGDHVRLSADVRTSNAGGPSDGRALAAGGVVDLDRIAWSMLGARVRSTRFTSPWLTGWLHSGSVSIAPLHGQLRFELEGGMRAETNRPGTSVTGELGQNRVQWLTLDTEIALGRAWYIVMTGTRESAGWAPVSQGYGSISWRF